MPPTDRWSPDKSREHYRPQHGTRDHSRSSGGHSIGHDRFRARSAAGENRRGQRGRSRERSILTRVRPSRRPNPSEIRDRSMRREWSRSRERSTFSQHGSRRGVTSIRQGDTRHTPGRSTEPERKTNPIPKARTPSMLLKFSETFAPAWCQLIPFPCI